MKYFTVDELKDKSDGTFRLAHGFEEMLDALREEFNEPMVVTSGCRSPAHNAAVGGKPSSFHLTSGNPYCPEGTCAVDIKITSPDYKERLRRIAWRLGWTIGNAKTFLHLDRRIDYCKLPQIEFHYSDR